MVILEVLQHLMDILQVAVVLVIRAQPLRAVVEIPMAVMGIAEVAAAVIAGTLAAALAVPVSED